ncbi:MAG: DNA-binding response regulator [Methylophaga sp.]|nr:MAG: DNA-binding response regulator [Methylophaga sp.]
MNTQPISVLLIDDHTILREGYQRLLESAGFSVIGQAGNATDGYQAFITLKPKVCIIDLTMPPGTSGLECIRRICLHDKKACILVCSMHEESALAIRAMELGALGYITKSCSSDILIEAVNTVAEKKPYLAAELAHSIVIDTHLKPQQKINSLSHQEFAIFTMVANGMNIGEISKNLHLSPKTVSNYKTNMMRKLGLTKLADVIFLSQKYGLSNSSSHQ